MRPLDDFQGPLECSWSQLFVPCVKRRPLECPQLDRWGVINNQSSTKKEGYDFRTSIQTSSSRAIKLVKNLVAPCTDANPLLSGLLMSTMKFQGNELTRRFN